MQSWRKSVGQKLAVYHEEKDKDEVEPLYLYDTYEEAKKAGSVSGMLQHKMRDRREEHKKITSLSNEIYSTKSITEIQNRIKELERSVEKQEETVQLLEQAQERKFRKEFSRIGGLVGIHLDAAVYEAMNGWLSTDEKYLEAVTELKTVKKDYTAHCNAKELYLEDNKDLIEAEREKNRRRDLLSSGILEELGITQSEE